MIPKVITPLGGVFSGDQYDLIFRGSRIKKAIYHGNVIWESEDKRADDVCIWDWDGTLLKSYSSTDFLNLSDLPAVHRRWTAGMVEDGTNIAGIITNGDVDDHDLPIFYDSTFDLGLTPAGFNWTLSDAKNYVKHVGVCDIGCLYTSPVTYVWIVVPYANTEYHFYSPTRNTSIPVEIDFGDGGEIKKVYGGLNTMAGYVANQTFAQPGKYLAKVYNSGDLGGLFTDATVKSYNAYSLDGLCDYGGNVGHTAARQTTVHAYSAFVGSNIGINVRAFYKSYVRFLGIAADCPHFITSQSLNGMANIKHLTLPSKITSAGTAGSDTYGSMGIYRLAFGAGQNDGWETFSYPGSFSGTVYQANAQSLKRLCLPYLTNIVYLMSAFKCPKVYLPFGVDRNRPRTFNVNAYSPTYFVPTWVDTGYMSLSGKSGVWDDGAVRYRSILSGRTFVNNSPVDYRDNS